MPESSIGQNSQRWEALKSYFVVDCDDRNMLNANFNVFFLWNIKNEKDNLYLGKFSYQKKGVTVRG